MTERASPSGNAADRSQARHTQKGVNEMTKTDTYTTAQNLDNEKIAAIIAGMTPEQRQLIGGLVIGVQLAGQIWREEAGSVSSSKLKGEEKCRR